MTTIHEQILPSEAGGGCYALIGTGLFFFFPFPPFCKGDTQHMLHIQPVYPAAAKPGCFLRKPLSSLPRDPLKTKQE